MMASRCLDGKALYRRENTTSLDEKDICNFFQCSGRVQKAHNNGKKKPHRPLPEFPVEPRGDGG